MKDQAILANAGHFDIEIDKKHFLLDEGPKRVRNVEVYTFASGRRIYLLGKEG